MVLPPDTTERPGWVFLSNHGYVLLTIARDPTMRLRDIAAAVGIAERATIRIVRQLADEGYLRRHRVGRRNVYMVDESVPLRHPAWRDRQVRLLLTLAQRAMGDSADSVAHFSGATNGGTRYASTADGGLGHHVIGVHADSSSGAYTSEQPLAAEAGLGRPPITATE